MAIGSTISCHKNIHRATWKSPDGQTMNEIYHILTDMRHKSNLMDIRTFRGANTDSDHFLVVSKLRTRISNCKKEHSTIVEKYNIHKLKNIDILTLYKKT
jgi:hypothetical protein